MRVRPTPSFVIAVIALVVALGSVSYAAIVVGSPQIKNNSVKSVDVKNRTLTSKDVKKKSLRSDVLVHTCRAGERRTLGMCMARAASGPSSYLDAVRSCEQKGGRLPTLGELAYIAGLPGITWADGQANQYEFTSTYTQTFPTTPMARDQGGNLFPDASASNFWHHCLRLP
jgi:hypothetical protein